MTTLTGKVAIVTGAARGMGRSIAVTLAAAGADLVICDVCKDMKYPHYSLGTYEQLMETSDQIKKLGRKVHAIRADVGESKQVDRVVTKALTAFGRIDILVNNAGIAGISPLHEFPEEDWDILMDTNLKGVFLFCKAVIPEMISKKCGKIVNTASIGGLRGLSGFTHYCASKFGVIGLTKSLAVELAPFNINVNAVAPGTTDTDLDAGVDANMAPGQGKHVYAEYHLFKRLVDPQEIAGAVLWLASDEAKNVTGHALVVDGGFLLA
jgi:NAD(P)-dependent dehydrogenase (short-subunit alcohol dehydrogenase family)